MPPERMNADEGQVWPFFVDWSGNRAPKGDGKPGMSLWQGLVLSLLIHAALFSIPITTSVKPVPTFEELKLVMETGADLPSEAPRGSMSEDRMVSSASALAIMGQTGMEEASVRTAPPEFEMMVNPRQTLPSKDMPPEVEENPSTTAPPQESKPTRKPAGKTFKIPSESSPSKTPLPIRQRMDASQSHLSHPAPETPPGESPSPPSPKSPRGNGESSAVPSTAGSGETRGFGPAEQTFGKGEGPTFRRRVIPTYPRRAREAGKEGAVLLRLSIDEKGTLLRVEVLEKAGFGFDEEAVRAVKESTFRAATRGGRPVACSALLSVRFVLRSDTRD